jgi:hypothetical protein
MNRRLVELGLRQKRNDDTAGTIHNAPLDGNRTGCTAFNGSGRKRRPRHRQGTSQVFYGRPSEGKETEDYLAPLTDMIIARLLKIHPRRGDLLARPF